MGPLNISDPDKSGFSHIQIKGQSKQIEVAAATLNQLKIVNEQFSERDYVPLKSNSNPIFIKISDLSRKLNIPENEIVDASKEGTLEELIQVEMRCEFIFRKLDQLYLDLENAENIHPQDVFKPIAHEDLEGMKKVVKSAYTALAQNADLQKIQKPVSSHIVISSPDSDSIRITGLFGKVVGEGTLGKAVHTVDLMKGEWAAHDEAVLKIPKATSAMELENDIANEVEILEKIHKNGQVLGIQKRLKLVRNVLSTLPKAVGHMGQYYDDRLSNMIDRSTLAPIQKMHMAYQLFHGLAHMHKLSITHGDIKPDNVFCRGDGAFLADFGGALDHAKRGEHTLDKFATPTYSPTYRVKQDQIDSEDAFMEREFDEQKKIEMKADVFALCVTVYELFVQTKPFDSKHQPYSGHLVITSDAEEQLMNVRLSKETAQLIVQGLAKDRLKRPSAEKIAEALKKDLSK
jgi:serine/threonine protein kinase